MAPPAYDLIVVGSGFAGSMTTLNFLETAKKNGKTGKVALIEVGQDDERCGASRWTMAYLRLDKDFNFDEDWKKEMARVSNGKADQEYCQKLEKEAKETVEYVQAHGQKFIIHEEPNVLLEFKTAQHFVYPEGGGHSIINNLMAAIKKFDNCDIYWETEGRKLLTDEDGRISGLQVRTKDGLTKSLHAPNVMLACGGFEGNNELLARYIGKGTHHLPLIAPGLVHNKGAGLTMALDVGAQTAGSFDGMHCELVDTRSGKPDSVIWGHLYGAVVNKHCERFYDEGNRHLFSTFEMVALETWRDHEQEAYFITDAPIMKRFRPGWVYDTTEKDPEEAPTIRELAQKLKLDPDALEKTINDFNAAINDKPFDLMKLDGKATTGLKVNKTNWANPINTPPFYGYPMTANLTFTYGGIKTNTKAEVLGTNGAPIPGLYAAGELTGLFYNEYPPATSVLRSLTFGRLAGTAIGNGLK